MAIYHLEHGYLNWRAIPCRRKMICVYAVFIIFSTFFFTSWFLFRLNSNFSSAWHDNQFFLLFCFFSLFFFTIYLLRATMYAIDSFSSWGVISHVRVVLEGWLFGPRLFISFLSKRGLWLKSVLEKWVILVYMPQGINHGGFKISRF